MNKKNKKSKKTEKRKKLEAFAESLILEPVKKKKPKKAKAEVPEVVEQEAAPVVTPVVTPKQAPHLELILGNISGDGQVEVRMDWNQEFLNQIRGRGFSASREEEAIMSFLNWMFIVRLSDTPDAAIEASMPLDLKAALQQNATTGEVVTG